jgi:hypothetical protein
VPAEDSYRIGGDGIRPSEVFHLAGVAGIRIVLTVDAKSTSVRAAGQTILLIGAVTTAVGVGGLVLALLVNSLNSKYGGGGYDPVPWLLTLLGGGILLVSGGVAASGSTQVMQAPLEAGATPTHAVATAGQGEALPRPTVLPVVRVTF